MSPACRFCGGGSTRLRFEAVDTNRRLSRERFPYHTCRDCGTLFLAPIPADLGEYYPAEYYALPSTAEALAELAEHERFKLELIRGAAPRGRLLEIGPGTGAFASLAKADGYDVEVMEMDAAACAFLERVVGVRAHNRADVGAAVRELGDYDVIALWHVIEHLPDPRETLAAAAERLTRGGALVVAAPNPGALQFRLFGRRWTHLDAPRHLQLIPPDALSDAAARVGLRPRALTLADAGGIGWNHFGWRHSLGNLSTRHSRRARLQSLGDRTNRLMRRVEWRGRLGTAYTIIFEKE